MYTSVVALLCVVVSDCRFQRCNSPDAEVSIHSVYLNLRSCHLRLTGGCAPLCSLILVCVSLLVRRKFTLDDSLAITGDTHNG
jgi:hypothetical protein